MIAVRDRVASGLSGSFSGDPQADAMLAARYMVPAIRKLSPGRPVAETAISAIKWSAVMRRAWTRPVTQADGLLGESAVNSECHPYLTLSPELGAAILAVAGEHDRAAEMDGVAGQWRAAEDRLAKMLAGEDGDLPEDDAYQYGGVTVLSVPGGSGAQAAGTILAQSDDGFHFAVIGRNGSGLPRFSRPFRTPDDASFAAGECVGASNGRDPARPRAKRHFPVAEVVAADRVAIDVYRVAEETGFYGLGSVEFMVARSVLGFHCATVVTEPNEPLGDRLDACWQGQFATLDDAWEQADNMVAAAARGVIRAAAEREAWLDAAVCYDDTEAGFDAVSSDATYAGRTRAFAANLAAMDGFDAGAALRHLRRCLDGSAVMPARAEAAGYDPRPFQQALGFLSGVVASPEVRDGAPERHAAGAADRHREPATSGMGMRRM